MDVSTTGEGGGPYTSTMNLINSSLKEEYDYRIFEYNTSLGRFISIKRIKDMVRQLKEIKPDIVHFTGLQFSGFHIAVACRLAGIKRSVVVIRGSSTEAMNISRFQRVVLYLLEFITLTITKKYYGVCTHASKISATKYFPKKSLGHIFNLRPLVERIEESFTRQELGFDNDDIVVVTVTRVIKDKGCHILAEAIRSFSDNTKIKFLIIGDGAYVPQMKNELSSAIDNGQVKFTGYRDDVYRFLPACDMLVLPTLHENLSNALLEGMQYGLPLIASNVGGNPEVIAEGVNGLLPPPADSSALSEAILKLSSDANLRNVMGENGKQILEQKFSDKAITEKVREVYENLLTYE